MKHAGQLLLGFHAVRIALERHPRDIEAVWLSAERNDKRTQPIEQLAQAAGIAVQRISPEELSAMAGEERHQGVAARRRSGKTPGEQDLAALLTDVKAPLLLVLDGVQDPHNLGACLRSAAAAGAQAVIVPRDNAAPLTAVVQRAAAGAAEIVPLVTVTNLARTLTELKEQGVWLYGATHDAEQTIYQTDLTGPAAIVLGGEGKGLRRLTREYCDGLMRIPMSGEIESLNVSVASGVCLFEAVRQRTGKRDR